MATPLGGRCGLGANLSSLVNDLAFGNAEKSSMLPVSGTAFQQILEHNPSTPSAPAPYLQPPPQGTARTFRFLTLQSPSSLRIMFCHNLPSQPRSESLSGCSRTFLRPSRQTEERYHDTTLDTLSRQRIRLFYPRI